MLLPHACKDASILSRTPRPECEVRSLTDCHRRATCRFQSSGILREWKSWHRKIYLVLLYPPIPLAQSSANGELATTWSVHESHSPASVWRYPPPQRHLFLRCPS